MPVYGLVYRIHCVCRNTYYFKRYKYPLENCDGAVGIATSYRLDDREDRVRVPVM
jgi:hypothetical protein